MDKVIEVIMVAAVLAGAAAIILFILTGQTDLFTERGQAQVNDAQCDLWETKAQRGDTQAEEKFDENCDGSIGSSSGSSSPPAPPGPIQ